MLLSDDFLNNVRATKLILSSCQKDTKSEYADWRGVEDLVLRNWTDIVPCLVNKYVTTPDPLCSSIKVLCVDQEHFKPKYCIFTKMRSLQHLIFKNMTITKEILPLKKKYGLSTLEIIRCKVDITGFLALVNSKFPSVSTITLIDNTYPKSSFVVDYPLKLVHTLTIDQNILKNNCKSRVQPYEEIFKIFPNVEHFKMYQRKLKSKLNIDGSAKPMGKYSLFGWNS